MSEQIKLSELVWEIGETIEEQFDGRTFWVPAQVTNVRKYVGNRRCYLTLEEYEEGEKVAELKAVFWANSYPLIARFEKEAGQAFCNGIEVTVLVKVRYHPVYGLNADVLDIDIAHTIGSLEIERQKTLERLLKENATDIQLYDGVYRTYNNRLPLPPVISNIALVTAPNSDGQRDFLQEIGKNRHGYKYLVHEYLTTIQGENAHRLILEQLNTIAQSTLAFDAVAIVRGGGSQTDFKPFDDYDLARSIATFRIPIFTGIGHDSNQSIVDLMAREQKTPTKVAALFVDHNFEFENGLIRLKERFYQRATEQIQGAKDALKHARRIVKLSDPQLILDRGFAMILQDNKIVTDPQAIKEGSEIQTVLKDEIITSTVTKKEKQ